jgi:hypothetical protein
LSLANLYHRFVLGFSHIAWALSQITRGGLDIPPFLGLHLVFNMDLLCPYFPPLLDTSKVAEQLTPKEINPKYIQQESSDHIVDTHIKGT